MRNHHLALMRKHHFALSLSTVAAMVALALGCHADANDAAGQAGELSDAVRRENAVANIHRLYADALARADGDHSAAAPRAVADVSVERLSQTYVEHPEDVTNGLRILEVLVEMRDPRGLPALTKALDWRPEVSEEHAIRAARVLQQLELDEAQKGEVVTAISAALDRVSQSRGVDNRMRIEFLRALGAMGDRRATLMANHGLLAIGRTVEEALETAAYAEEGARIYLLTRPLGEPREHPRPSVGMMYAPSWWRRE